VLTEVAPTLVVRLEEWPIYSRGNCRVLVLDSLAPVLEESILEEELLFVLCHGFFSSIFW